MHFADLADHDLLARPDKVDLFDVLTDEQQGLLKEILVYVLHLVVLSG